MFTQTICVDFHNSYNSSSDHSGERKNGINTIRKAVVIRITMPNQQYDRSVDSNLFADGIWQCSLLSSTNESMTGVNLCSINMSCCMVASNRTTGMSFTLASA